MQVQQFRQGFLGLFTGIAITLGAFAVVADSEPTKRQLIDELLEVTGSHQMSLDIFDQLLGSMVPAFPDVPQEVWAEFRREAAGDGFEKLVVPIYDKHFTKKELAASLAFYRTPEGSSLLTKMPLVMQESVAAGQRWGQEAAGRIVEQLRNKGFEPKTL